MYIRMSQSSKFATKNNLFTYKYRTRVKLL